MENVLQFAKQNEAFLWRFLIVIVFAIVLLNLYLRQRLKINKELKKPAESKENFKPGDRINYASRVYDEKEMCSLVDAALDFWLTTGRFSDEFEKKFAEWIGVKFANLVNSGSSANLIAFMALTAPELGERQIKKGDEIITVACGFPTTVTPAIQY